MGLSSKGPQSCYPQKITCPFSAALTWVFVFVLFPFLSPFGGGPYSLEQPSSQIVLAPGRGGTPLADQLHGNMSPSNWRVFPHSKPNTCQTCQGEKSGVPPRQKHNIKFKSSWVDSHPNAVHQKVCGQRLAQTHAVYFGLSSPISLCGFNIYKEVNLVHLLGEMQSGMNFQVPARLCSEPHGKAILLQLVRLEQISLKDFSNCILSVVPCRCLSSGLGLTSGCGSKPMGSYFGVGAPPILPSLPLTWHLKGGPSKRNLIFQVPSHRCTC